MAKYSLTIELKSERDLRLVAIAAEAITNTDHDHMPYAFELQTVFERANDNLRETGSADGYEGWVSLADSMHHRAEELIADVASSFSQEVQGDVLVP